MKILFIHGAGSTKNSFRYMSNCLSLEHDCLFYEYDMDNSNVSTNIMELKKYLDQLNHDVLVVGHSLGGIFALGIIDHPLVKKTITLSAPLGGMLVAGLYGWVTTHSMCKDLMPHSNTLTSIKKIAKNANKTHVAFITTHGMSFFHEENDGVVLVNSQMAWDTPIYKKMNCNHFEILMADEVIDIIIKEMEI